MKILMASSEVVPFAKTGGLADVVGALPRELESLGHEVVVFLPAYACVFENAEKAGLKIEPVDVELEIPISSKIVDGRLLKTQLPDSNVVVYLAQYEEYFDRPALYGNEHGDFPDNCERFVFFSRSILEAIRLLDLKPDLIHVNDWQTGLLPALMKLEYANTPGYEQIPTLLTIHNLAYQGNFWHWDMLLTGLDWKHFNWQEMEHFGQLNLLKAGIVFADAINTVSPTYAREIQMTEQGCGLDSVLQHRSHVLSGIINGIDPKDWNPATDPFLPANFDVSNWQPGKAECKAKLQSELRLEIEPRKPLIGIVGRLASQKGWSLILPVLNRWLETNDAQWAILGTGDPDYHEVLSSMHRSFPNKMSATLGFSNEMAHRIEAAADIFLMPSQYEPCGLNQMYSMAYGTVPVVRATGGLADTVVNSTSETIANQTANGFSFEDFTTAGLESALSRAVRLYADEPDSWAQLVTTGMKRDWSWTASAKDYQQLYQRTIQQMNARPTFTG